VVVRVREGPPARGHQRPARHRRALPDWDESLTGDLAALAGLVRLSTLNLGNTAVTGDVGGLAGLAELSYLKLLGNTAVTGWPLVTAGGRTFADADDYSGTGTG
jgi:hypothetical protein